MKFLVLGCNGFIGHNLVKRLKSEGYYVVGVDKSNIKVPSEYEDMEKLSKLCNSTILLLVVDIFPKLSNDSL